MVTIAFCQRFAGIIDFVDDAVLSGITRGVDFSSVIKKASRHMVEKAVKATMMYFIHNKLKQSTDFITTCICLFNNIPDAYFWPAR